MYYVSMRKTAVIWKQVGETPLRRLEHYRLEAGIATDVPIAYAGRLDPLAEGKLLLLIGDECKKMKSYTGLDKVYTFEVLFGFSSDTGDVLGIAEKANRREMPTRDALHKASLKLLGKVSFPYPKFSSKTVQGKQLHKWALEGRIDEIEIPLRVSKIYKLALYSTRTISKESLEKIIFEKINSIPPVTDPSKAHGRDFRRAEIRARWKELFTENTQTEFLVATFVCNASSGTYMRTLAEEIGKLVGEKSLALSIRRDEIGKLVHIGPFHWWLKKY
ncbi:hypothetical protein EPO56_03245 [Patescibacteria group bacterium]|nr:MAG: hypothetical protein EPO56_03245 [Patescibacteria group bacterium]